MLFWALFLLYNNNNVKTHSCCYTWYWWCRVVHHWTLLSQKSVPLRTLSLAMLASKFAQILAPKKFQLRTLPPSLGAYGDCKPRMAV